MKINFFKKLSNGLMFLNPVIGFCILASIITSAHDSDYWWLLFVPLLLTAFGLILWFYDWSHRDEFRKMEIERSDFLKTHTHLYSEKDYDTIYRYYRNNRTKLVVTIHEFI